MASSPGVNGTSKSPSSSVRLLPVGSDSICGAAGVVFAGLLANRLAAALGSACGVETIGGRENPPAMGATGGGDTMGMGAADIVGATAAGADTVGAAGMAAGATGLASLMLLTLLADRGGGGINSLGAAAAVFAAGGGGGGVKLLARGGAGG